MAAAVDAQTASSRSMQEQFRARATAFFNGLSGGSYEQFVAMIQENFAPAALSRENTDRSRARYERQQLDLGKMTLAHVEVQTNTVILDIKGATGYVARVELRMQTTPPYLADGYFLMVDRPNPMPAPQIDPAMSSKELTAAIDAYFAPLVRSAAFAGVVLIAKDGAPLVERAYGMADRQANIPAQTDTRFSLASVGKLFTKTAVAQLIQRGMLTLTSTIGELLPDYPNESARRVTVSQLVNHQAGIVDFFGPAFDAAPKSQFRSNADYYRFVAPKPLLFPPGTRTQYCNGCYVVLGAIIEQLAGVPYEQYVMDHVFDPAGMKTAGFFRVDRLPPHTAIGYTRRASASPSVLTSNKALSGSAPSAAGGVYSTAADLLAFDNSLREGRLLDAKMTAWMFDPGPVLKGARGGGNLRIVGGAPGMNAFLTSDSTWTVVVLSNMDPSTADQAGGALAARLATRGVSGRR